MVKNKLIIPPLEPPPDVRADWKGDGWTGFNVVSLGAWLALCRDAGVDHVPAEEVATVAIDDLLRYDHDPPPPTLREFFSKLDAAKQQHTMLRWDCCASMEVKHALGTGKPDWDPEFLRWFTIDDPRAFELIFEYPGDQMTVWRRPWMQTEIRDNYPVEYRVFVQDGTVRGISSYYPQRPLDQDRSVTEDVISAKVMTVLLIEALPTPVCHLPGRGLSPDSKSFTADFMRLEDERLVFLEGGPPFGAGAHPCCFDHVDDWAEAAAFTVNDVPVALQAQGEVRP